MNGMACLISDEDVEKHLQTTLTENQYIANNVPRATADFKDLSEVFEIRDQDFNRQYAGVYFCRLNKLRKSVVSQAHRKWKSSYKTCATIDELTSRETCFITGTLYKDMKLKPCVLNQYMTKLDVDSNIKGFVSSTDFVVLEDETSRIRLVPSDNNSSVDHETPCDSHDVDHLASSMWISGCKQLLVDKLVTGLVIGILGRRTECGSFVVSEWTLPGVPAIQRPLSLPTAEVKREKKYIAFVSGLEIGGLHSGLVSSLSLLKDFLLGSSGNATEFEFATGVSRLVIVGNAMRATTSHKPTEQRTTPEVDSFKNDAALLDEIDSYMAEIAASVYVDVMPGADDPGSLFLPQQPLHPSLFEQAKRFGSYRSTTNPYAFEVDGRKFVGSSGQPVDDVLRYSSIESPLDALELTVQARCLAPTAPDTLACFPLISDDPFCLPGCDENEPFPDVVFVGGTSRADYRFARHVDDDGNVVEGGPLCLCVPDFVKEPCAVLVETNTLDVALARFS
eukprot:Lankesteria_metandrocarpae@DN1615_c0_g2_i2.p1